jgi:hypothetical protein
MGGTWRRKGIVAVATAMACVTLTVPATAAGGPKVVVNVSEECTAPFAPGTNYCGFAGILSGLGVEGFDIGWEVTLLFSDHWRIQFQAFSDTGTAECQYPIRVWGSYSAPGLRRSSFVSSSALDLGITPADYPNVTLRVDRIRIDTKNPTCG